MSGEGCPKRHSPLGFIRGFDWIEMTIFEPTTTEKPTFVSLQ